MFSAGQILATPGVIEAFDSEFITQCLARHLVGDWGEICDEDRGINEAALVHGARLLSVYSQGEERLWVITEADRSSTTVLLPSEY